MSERRIVLLVAYDGGPYRGFAAQGDPSLPTVGGALAGALEQIAGVPLAITCAGRTDAGVHALGQVVHADLPVEVVDRQLGGRRSAGGEDASGPGEVGELPRLVKSLTSQLAPTVVVARALVAPAGFHARHSAIARRYRYHIARTPVRNPLERYTTWHVPGELDVAAMRIAADCLLGTHEFSAFCRRPPGTGAVEPLVRRVGAVSVSLSPSGDHLAFEIEANAFCHQMVRSIVATLVGVGRGKLQASAVLEHLRNGERSGERALGGQLAPAEGLVLVEVRYPDELIPGGVL